ncbi:MAG: hypothetical protein APF76_00145 [Desulfitibacter sp. BRH_c19]|nr:MAG: hypothetical protein APF76_00145 [Desulfitibacter sp. BRH_c19]
MFINVPVQTFIIQRATPNEYMSRMFSIVGMITKGGMPFGALVYGFVLNSVEMHWTILTATLLMMLISVVLAGLFPCPNNPSKPASLEGCFYALKMKGLLEGQLLPPLLNLEN